MLEKKINFAIVGDLAFDQTITPKASRRVVAGAAYNTAVAASLIAESGTVGVVARAGEDFQEGLSALQRRTVNTEGISVVKGGKTALFTIIQGDDNTRELQASPGVSDEVDTAIFPESYRDASYVHLASSNPEKYLQWIPYLRRTVGEHTIISADANDLFIHDAIDATVTALHAVDLVFINEAELAAIRSKYPDFNLTKPTVLKRGAKGATYIDMQAGVEFSVDAPNVEVIDTTGAGDTLAGVFLARRAKGDSVEIALTDAVNVASKTVTDFGVEHINP